MNLSFFTAHATQVENKAKTGAFSYEELLNTLGNTVYYPDRIHSQGTNNCAKTQQVLGTILILYINTERVYLF